MDTEFHFDLEGRIHNLSLPPSQANSLLPLFEAISNSIHAIEMHFGNAANEHGEISIAVQRAKGGEGPVTGFVISDNGVGLNDENYRSFRTSDSPFKRSRGGKGVGRLSWLKAFTNVGVTSTFKDGDKLVNRTFDFSLAKPTPIKNHKIVGTEQEDSPGTIISLDGFHSEFEAHCPRKSDTIAAKLVGHFLPYLVSGRMPKLKLKDAGVETNILDFLTKNQKANIETSIPLTIGGTEQKFSLHHVLLHKSMKFHEGGLHWMFYQGNDRVVRSEPIDTQLGLKLVGPAGDCIYIGVVSGPYLGSHVNQERTGFTFTDEIFKDIHKASVNAAKEFLSEYILRIRESQKKTASRVIISNPQFLPFRDDLDTFVAEKLALNIQSEEEIFLELSRHKLRNKRALKREIVEVSGKRYSVDLDEKVRKITDALQDDMKSSLAEYVVRRKEILEVLDSSIAYQDPEKRDYLREEVIHELICPMRSSSEELEYADHNLWLLDDRMAFYAFFQSDKTFKTFVEGSDSRKEPDLAVMFDTALAFQREGKDEPMIIVEFKKPGRDNYTGNTNPVSQVLEYVDVFRSGTAIKNFAGKTVKPISNSTRFICYVVADLTDSLKRVVRYSPANHETGDGDGYFGYSDPHNAYVEVLPYDKLLRDAKIRNEAFFSRLNLK